MTPSTWRLPEAPRPSHTTSRGTAVLFWAAVVLFQTPTSLVGDGTLLLEAGGRPLCTGEAGIRRLTAVLSDGANGSYLLTQDERPLLSVGEGTDAFLLHLDSDLGPLPFGDGIYASSPCGALLLGGAGDHYSAAGALIAPERLAVAMGYEVSEGADYSQLFVQAYDASGTALFGAYPVRVSTPLVESRLPFLLPDGEGGLFYAWNEAPQWSITQIGDLFLQRFDSAGRPLWERRTVVSGGFYGGASWPTLAPDGEGGVYISFLEPRIEEFPNDYERIRVQRVGGEGALLWPPGGLTPWDGNRSEDPISAVVSDGPDGAIVLFGADGRVRAQKMSPGGERLWGREGIVLSDPPDPFPTSYSYAVDPRVIAGDDGILYVYWEEYRELGYRALAARRLERDGRLPWPGPVTLVVHDAGIWRSRAAVLADGSLAAVWEDARVTRSDSSDASDVYIQVVDRRGRTKAPVNGMPVIAAPLGQQSPFVLRPGRPFAIPPGTDTSLPQALVLWSDGRFPSLTGWSSTAYLAQAMAFNSRPQIAATPTVTLRESSEATIVLHGSDLQQGLVASAGDGIAIEAAAEPDSPEGPGDTLTLRVLVGPAPDAAPDLHDLSIHNPDGGALLVPSFLAVTLDPRRVDVDRSGRVDGFDLAVLARAFGRTKGEDLYSLTADIDANGLVDGSDLALLAASFGEQMGGDGGVAPAR